MKMLSSRKLFKSLKKQKMIVESYFLIYYFFKQILGFSISELIYQQKIRDCYCYLYRSEQMAESKQAVKPNFSSVSSLFESYPQKYFNKLLYLKDKNLFGFQTSHIMVMYFIIQGLASNNSLNSIKKQEIVNYIKSLQLSQGGFAASSLYTNLAEKSQFNLPHIVFTYSAVNILKILNALGEINKEKCLQSVKKCFKENGSVSNFANSNQADLRFVYAALAICNAFQDFSIVDKVKVKQYIDSCFNYDGGYGLRPYCESHAGAIYCAIASYKILGYEIPHSLDTLQFLINRQTSNQQQNLVGVQGRVGKLPDSCYTFWVGASIKMITGQNLLNENISNFLKFCYNQDSCNFSKFPNLKGDPLHTLHSSVGLKILFQKDFQIDIIQGTTYIQTKIKPG